ncbi:MAG: hypothetical protein RLZ98_2704 [Pseudomonadota bacterium]|jgi:amino acid transporter
MAAQQPTTAAPRLLRSLTLGHAILYGLGVTIGAGIYVLIGAAAGIAGYLTPFAFLFAAAVLAPTSASLAELASRIPLAAGEAEYVRAGFRSESAALWVGLLTAAISIISAGAIAVGSAGYIAVFVPLPAWMIITVVVIAMGLVSAWGIRESVTFAGLMTMIEIGGLLLIIAVGFLSGQALVLPEKPLLLDSPPPATMMGLLLASMLAVFAFVGFEALANIAEEVEQPERNLPRAIYATLAITTVLYVLVVWVSLTAVGPTALSQSQAPLALVFEQLTGLSPLTMSAIAVVATLNGIIVQIIMSSRIFYGLARQGNLPKALAGVNPVTHTPILSTALTTLIVLGLALAVPLEDLALFSSRLLLALFILINAALIAIKRRDPEPAKGVYVVPAWIPWLGLACTIAFLAADVGGMLTGR